MAEGQYPVRVKVRGDTQETTDRPDGLSDRVVRMLDMAEDRLVAEEADPCANGHDKCFSNNVHACYPAIYPWICRRCGVQGQDRGQLVDISEYDRLVEAAKEREEAGK